MTLPEKIIQLRRDRGITQEQLAEQLHISRQAVSRWETGSALPDAANLLLLSSFFQVSVDYLLNDTQSTPKQMSPPAKNLPTSYHKVMFYFVTMEILVLLMQFLSLIVLASPFFTVLSTIPFVAMIVGFEYAYRKNGKPGDDTAKSFRKRFYQISAWLGCYFPARLLVIVATQLLFAESAPIVTEIMTLVIYLCSAVCIMLNLESHDL